MVNDLMLDTRPSAPLVLPAQAHQPVGAASPRLRDPSLAQSPEFQRALAATGQSPLILPDLDQTLVTHRRFLGRFPLAMVNRSSIAQPQLLLEALCEAGLARTPIILSPNQPRPALARLGALPLIGPAHVALLDLSACHDRRRAALHQKWRNRLTRAQAQAKTHTLRITRQTMPSAPSHWLLGADQRQQRQRGYRSWPIALTLAYAQQNKGQAKLFQAFEGKQAIAGVLILRHGQAASYHISHATARGKALSAHNLLIWEAMTWLANTGCRQLDLGLINTEDAPGLARFKLGTGARLVQLGGTWLYHAPLRRCFAPLARWDAKMMSAT